MADFVKITNTGWYIGASTDTKPTVVPSGSTCYEHDTGKLYITYNGGTNWVEKPSEDGVVDVLGTTAGAAVITDVAGTIQQYLRGLVKLIAAKITVGIDQTTPGTTNGVQVNAALPAGDNNIGNVDVASLPAGNLGQQAMAASVSTVPANNITDATYIGDIKFGEALPAGSAVIGKVGIDQTTPGTTNLVESKPSSRRNAGVLHRDAITAVDKLTDIVDGSVTLANVAGTQGSLVFNTAYYMTAIPGNRWGPCKVNTNIDSLTVTNDAASTHVIQCTVAQCTGATYYDLFLSTDTAPKWVARITEDQRATGGEVLTLATITAGASAGVFNIGVVGTGIQTSNAVFAQNNAYTPASITSIDCSGRTKAHILAKLALTDLRSAPTLRIVPFTQNQLSTNDWHQGSICTVGLLGALGQSLEQEFILDVEGAEALVIAIDTCSGQGAAASIWVDLV